MSLNIAMIATGRIADTQLAPAIAQADGAELWSVYSRDKSKAEDFARHHGASAGEPAFDDLETLLADADLATRFGFRKSHCNGQEGKGHPSWKDGLLQVLRRLDHRSKTTR